MLVWPETLRQLDSRALLRTSRVSAPPGDLPITSSTCATLDGESLGMGDGRRAGLWRGSFEIRPAGRVALRPSFTFRVNCYVQSNSSFLFCSAATHGAAVAPREGWHHHHPALHQRWPYVPASARLLECGVQQQFAASLLPSVAMSSATGPVLGCAVSPAESRHSPPPHPPRRVPGTLGMCAQPRPQ